MCYSRIAPGAVNYELRYGTFDALGWTLETIPRSGERALGPCVLAVDAAGRTLALTMYWWGLASSAFRLSTRTATGWTHADVSRALSIVDVEFALDASGRAHIARENTLDASEPRYIDYLSQ